MGLADELQEARAAVARAKSGHRALGDSLNKTVDASTAGSQLRNLEQAITDAEANLTRVEGEVLERARAIVEERDPGYAAKLANARLVGEVEKHALIGAADRLSGL